MVEYFLSDLTGVPLQSKRLENRGNATYLGMDKDKNFRVVTDYGNLVRLTVGEFEECYKIPLWYIEHRNLCKEYNVEDDFLGIHNVKTRLNSQVELLQKAIKSI